MTIPFEMAGKCGVSSGGERRRHADGLRSMFYVSVGVPCNFGAENQVDWVANPTYNGYGEWTWQLSRHNEWKILARVYRKTGDEKYAKACADLFESWVKQAVFPAPGGYGDRMLANH